MSITAGLQLYCSFPVCLTENGPYHIKEDLSLERSEYGWDVNSNMIFVDQPINTGFSYSDVSLPPSHARYSC